MIVNTSRGKDYQRCKTYAYNLTERRLAPLTDAEPLIRGSAVHAGFASVLAGESLAEAQTKTKAVIEERLEGQLLLPEERQLYDHSAEVAVEATKQYAEQLPSEGFQVLRPEVRFCVELPNTMHHCWYAHKLLYPDVPFAECQIKDKDTDGLPHKCIQPHRFIGRTDALVSAEGMIWLLEHKTSSDYRQSFWDNFLLDYQVTGYVYGIWKSTGIRPQGALVNKIQIPNKRQSISALNITREAYLRSDADLAIFEHDLILMATDYERTMSTATHYKNTANCYAYNRACMYHEVCMNHGVVKDPNAFSVRKPDYAEEELYKILGLEVPSATATVL